MQVTITPTEESPFKQRFYIGNDTGSLFFHVSFESLSVKEVRMNADFIVVHGKGCFAGREGEIVNPRGGRGVRALPTGTLVEIII